MAESIIVGVEKRPLADLRPFDRNPNNGDGEAIAASMEENGIFDGLVVDVRNNQILSGNHRYAAMLEAGETDAYVMFVQPRDDNHAIKINIAANQTAKLSRWDDGLLAQLLQSLPSVEGTGFDDSTLQELLARVAGPAEGLTDPDDVPAPPKVPVTQRGDLWLLGGHRLLCGDSTSKADIGRLVAGQTPGMLLMDPPYGMRLDTDFSGILGSLGSLGRKHGTRGNSYAPVEGDDEDYDPGPIMAMFEDVAEQFWFGADYYAERIPDRGKGSWLVWDKRKESQADAIGAEFELCWSRQKHKRRMLRHDWFGFLSSDNGSDARNRVHPTQKPVSLLVDIIKQWGGKATSVLDLYGGSGSTLIAAHQEGRVARLCEIDPAYVDVTLRRFQEHTSILPRREDGEEHDFTADA